jgi:nucleoside-diphosphate-sugar epimerase
LLKNKILNLVTGATGIVGSHLVLALLLKDEPVVACKQSTSDLSKVEELFSFYTPDYKTLFKKIKWVDVDICDIFSIEEALEGIVIVYHCAGFVSFNNKDRKKLFLINETGTKNVVDACLQKGIRTLCHVSSVATINNLDYAHTLNESVFWKTSGKESDYAISKYNAERQVWRGMEEGLQVVIVNPGVILSPGFWGQSSSRLFENTSKGNRFYTNGMAGYVAAPDVARAMIELVEKKQFGQRYILIENNYSFYTILSHIQGNFNKPLPLISASPLVLRFASYLERIVCFFTGKERKLTRSLIHAAFNKQLYSNAKVKAVLDIEFRSVHSTISEICAFYANQESKPKSSV